MTVHDPSQMAPSTTTQTAELPDEHGPLLPCAGLIPVQPLLRFAESIDARASDASYAQPPEVSEELLQVAMMLRGLIKERGKPESPHSHYHATWLAHELTELSARSAVQVHDLKCWPPFWEAIFTGCKTFEIRKDDRGYRVGDLLILREWDPTGLIEGPHGYTGRVCQRQVTHLLRGGQFGLVEGYVALSVRAVTS